MSDATTILKMIEEVSPDDWVTLDEIDRLVYLFVNDNRINVTGVWMTPRYTSSRDALKTIRPKEWGVCISGDYHGFSCDMWTYTFQAPKFHEPLKSFKTDSKFKTEELAELHAIVQAIEYDRSKK